MSKILYVYQKQQQKIINIHVMKIHLTYEEKMFKDEFTWYPRWGLNVIDKVKLKIFDPILAFLKTF